MIFTATTDNLSEREAWHNSYYNSLVDDIQAKQIVAGDFDYPFDFSGNVGFAGSAVYEVGYFGSSTTSSSEAIRIANGLGFTTSNTGAQNTTALQAIIDAMPSTGGVILIGPGTYLIGSTVELNGTSDDKNGIVLRGAGRGATILSATSGFTSSTPVLKVTNTPGSATSTNMGIEDLKVDCAGNAYQGIDMSAVTDGWVKMVEVDDALNAAGWGIRMSKCTRCVLEGVRITASDGDGLVVDATSGNNEANSLIDVHCYSNAGDGMAIFDNAAFTKLIACDFDTNSQVGLYLQNTSGSGTAWDGLTMVATTARDNTSHGFHFDSDHASSDVRAGQMVGCIADDNGGEGVLLDGVNGSSGLLTQWSLVGCAAIDNEESGFNFDVLYTSSVVGCASAGNTPSAGGSDGHYEFVAADGVMCVGNTAEGSGSDYGYVFDANTDDCVFDGCFSRSASSGLVSDSGGGGAGNSNYTVQEDGATANSVTNQVV